MKYFTFDKLDGDFSFFKTEDEARKEAEKILELYSEEAALDGWHDDMIGLIGYGKIIASTVETVKADRKDYTDDEWIEEGYSLDFDRIVSYSLCDIS